MRIVGMEPSHWDWVAKHMKILKAPDVKGVVAVDQNGAVVGALVGEQWTPSSCHVHVAITNPMALKHGLMEEWYRYVFEVCRRGMMIGVIRSDYRKSLNFARRLGWRELYRLNDGFAKGIDFIYMQYTKEQWLNRRTERWAA